MIRNMFQKSLKKKISENKPLFIGRMGSAELYIIENYFGIKKYKKSILNFILDKQPEWFWHPTKVREFNHIAGFFPIDKKLIEKYCELTLKDHNYSDMLGFTNTTFNTAKKYLEYFNPNGVTMCRQHNFEPYYATTPWTEILKDKKSFDLKDPNIQLILAIHYLSLNDHATRNKALMRTKKPKFD